jgi:hypothetical protein
MHCRIFRDVILSGARSAQSKDLLFSPATDAIRAAGKKQILRCAQDDIMFFE